MKLVISILIVAKCMLLGAISSELNDFKSSTTSQAGATRFIPLFQRIVEEVLTFSGDLPLKQEEVIKSQHDTFGQFQCSSALRLAKSVKKKPVDLADEMVRRLQESTMFVNINISAPGFINFSIRDEVLAEYANFLLNDERLGVGYPVEPKRVFIDFGGPNIAKAMHVGHLRSSIIGESLQRIFRFIGHEVTSDIHLGDWGLPMGMLIEELRLSNPDLPYFKEPFVAHISTEAPVVTIEELEKLYPAAAARCKEDIEARQRARETTAELQRGHPAYRALWKQFVTATMRDLKSNFSELDVHFDLWLGESSVNDILHPLAESLRDKGISTFEENGTVVVHVQELTDKSKIPPLIIYNSEGGLTYESTDLATILYRDINYKPDVILYVVDQRQGLHFEQLFRATRKAQILSYPTALEHIGFGTLNGKDGRPFKTRSGGILKLSDLLSLVTSKALESMRETNRGVEEKAQEISATSGVSTGGDNSVEITEEVITAAEEQKIKIAAKEVGIGAIKYADLARDRRNDYVFDLDQFMSFTGDTGAYILYTAVRIKALLRKAESLNIPVGAISLPVTQEERNLIFNIESFNLNLKRAEKERAPHYIAENAMIVAKGFTNFYQKFSILGERQPRDVSSARLALSLLTLKHLTLSFDLLGIKIPEKM